MGSNCASGHATWAAGGAPVASVFQPPARPSDDLAPPGGGAIGVVTSGTFGPSVERSIAMAYVASPHSAVGTELGVEIRGQAKAARVVRTPFHPSRVKKG